MIINVYAKSNYDLLRINKALGIFANLITTTTTTLIALVDPTSPKIFQWRKCGRGKNGVENGVALQPVIWSLGGFWGQLSPDNMLSGRLTSSRPF